MLRLFGIFLVGWVLAGCQTIPVDKNVFFVKEYSYEDCIILKAAKFASDGNATLFFERKDIRNYHYGECYRALVSAVMTIPNENITKVDGLSQSGTFYGVFSLHVKPDTTQVSIVTTDQFGASTTLHFKTENLVKQALALWSRKDWMTGLSKSDQLLEEITITDDTPPIIEFSDQEFSQKLPIYVESYTTYVRGKVRDDSGINKVLINGKRVSLRADGSFAYKIKLAVGRNDVFIQAEDVNSNITEEKFVIVRKEFFAEENLADVDMPPKTRMNNPDALAVVIGVESYQYVPDATYAYNDAEVFREYLAETMGMKRQRIKLATNSKATQAEFSKLLGPNGWLARNITKGKSDVVVYFSGHGIASPDAKSSGLLPHDVDPNYSVGLQTTQLYQDLAAMGARSVTVFLDACFTGQTRNSEMLIANARPIVIKPLASAVPENVTVISAASGSQISGALEEKEHGLFTYYLLKGLGGDADANKDKSINISELKSFVSAKVKEQAALNGREQTPEIQGISNNVLVRFQ